MITLFGAPGSGKTEQGHLLGRVHAWEWLSYQDLLRAMNNRDVNYALDHGMFIDDKTMDRMMQNAMARASSNAILDGFPTDLRQVRWLIDHGRIKDIKGAIILRVPHGELWRRLVARKRVDDTRAAIERRNEAFDRSITGITRALMQENIPVREVNGLGTPDDVRERIDEVLGEWGLIRRKQYAHLTEQSASIMARNTTKLDGDSAQAQKISFADILEALSELS